MTRDELLKLLKDSQQDDFSDEWSDREMVHVNADDALLKYINDPEITEAFNKIYKWYA